MPIHVEEYSFSPALCAVAVGTGILSAARVAPVTDYWSRELWIGCLAIGAMLGMGLGLFTFGAGYRAVRR